MPFRLTHIEDKSMVQNCVIIRAKAYVALAGMCGMRACFACAHIRKIPFNNMSVSCVCVFRAGKCWLTALVTTK